MQRFTSGSNAVGINIHPGSLGETHTGSDCSSTCCGTQRATLCIADGKNFQSILGGLNGDGYRVKDGPCMCNGNNMCGDCTSNNIIEIYME
jgi:hypothetical protein